MTTNTVKEKDTDLRMGQNCLKQFAVHSAFWKKKNIVHMENYEIIDGHKTR